MDASTHTEALPPEVLQQLWEAARHAQTKAYAPYSRYCVGAAVWDEARRIHAGCNVENAAYPQGWCAEASAISAMLMAGGKRIRGALVLGTGGSWITPCGGCRQKLREFADGQTPVVSATPEALGPVRTLAELLPDSFGPAHMGSA